MPNYLQRFAVACIILNECLALGKHMFYKNAAAIIILGFILNFCYLLGVFGVLYACVYYNLISEMHPSEYGSR